MDYKKNVKRRSFFGGVANKHGNSILYVFFLMLFVITIIVSFNTYRIGLANTNTRTVEDADEHNFLNNFEKIVTNKKLINLYQPTVIREEFNGREYIAEIEPTEVISKSPVTDIIDLTWNKSALAISNVVYDSRINNQFLTLAESNSNNSTDKYLISSKNFAPLNVYNLSGNILTLDNIPQAKKVHYRVNDGDMKVVTNYPTSRTVNLATVGASDIVNVEYLDKNGKVLKTNKFMKNSPSFTSWDKFTLTALPNGNRLEQVDLLKRHETTDSFRVSKRVDTVCYYNTAYSLKSYMAPQNNVTPKFSLKNPCPWEGIDGYHTISGYNSLAPYTDLTPYKGKANTKVPGSPGGAMQYYCSDPIVKTESDRRKTEWEGFVKAKWDAYWVRYNAAIADYQARYNAYKAQVEATYGQAARDAIPVPVFNPPNPGAPNPSVTGTNAANNAGYPPKPDTVPCIDGNRDSKLVQYETGKLITTQVNLNFVNNVTSDIEIIVEYERIQDRYPVEYRVHYLEGSDAYKLEEWNDNRSGSNPPIIIKHTMNKNYSYNRRDLIGTFGETEIITPREFTVAVENAIITKITVNYEEFDKSTFKFRIKDDEGFEVRKKDIEVTK